MKVPQIAALPGMTPLGMKPKKLEITNLEHAMVAENTLRDYADNKEDGDKYAQGDATICIDLIADICHLLHLDEKTAGCMTKGQIRNVLDTAFNHWNSETLNAE